ncbi:hypothetical protein AAY473_015817 [Plecturocebus cupreus]
MGFHHVGQAGLELLTSGDPTASSSQSAEITGVSHYAQTGLPNLNSLKVLSLSVIPAIKRVTCFHLTVVLTCFFLPDSRSFLGAKTGDTTEAGQKVKVAETRHRHLGRSMEPATRGPGVQCRMLWPLLSSVAVGQSMSRARVSPRAPQCSA